MDSDDLVIGSGLAALGAVLGLLAEPGRRTTVLCGTRDARFLHYDDGSATPCAYPGAGGLGGYWHGVIPIALRNRPGAISDADFCALFRRFYPDAGIDARVGQSSVFVPWRPIRPWPELRRLARQHGATRLALVDEAATRVRLEDGGVRIETRSGTFRARRCWVAAGALHTPDLLAASFGDRLARGLASDHVLCYLGQIEDEPRPEIRHTRNGFFVGVRADAGDRAVYTLRPARFDFRKLDAGFERRRIFNLPARTLLGRLAGSLSPGLAAEIAYNRLGLFGGGRCQSAYAQILAPDAYVVRRGSTPLLPQVERIRAAADAGRAAQPYGRLRASHNPERYAPGIHLHHTLDAAAVAAEGLDDAACPVQVVDASALIDIGGEHHSFKMLVQAHARVRAGAVTPTRRDASA